MDSNKSRGQGLLRSPGPTLESTPLPSICAEGKVRVEKLIDQVESIRLTEESLKSRSLQPYQDWFDAAVTDDESLKYAVEKLHHYWLSNHAAVKKAAIFVSAILLSKDFGLKVRENVLKCLQLDFEKRIEVQAKSPERYLNAAAFLVEMYSRIRIEKEPLHFMKEPVFQYLEELLSGDDAEIELFAHLVINIRSTLLEAGGDHHNSLSNRESLKNIFIKVRSMLMSRNLSSQSRLWLLFIMDVSSSGEFRSPSSSLQEFYKNPDHLGPAVEGLLLSLEAPSQCTQSFVPEKKCSMVEVSSMNNQISDLEISSKLNKKDNGGNVQDTNSNQTFQENKDLSDKRENFRSAFIGNKNSKGKDYWSHDDRFEKEDYSKEKRNDSFTRPRASHSNWNQQSTPKDGKETSRKGTEGNWRTSHMNLNQQPNTKDKREFSTKATEGNRIQSQTMIGHEVKKDSSKVIPSILDKYGFVDSESWDD